MKFTMIRSVAAAGLLALAGAAGATTITFDSLTNPGIWQYTTDTYTEQGYSFASNVPSNGYSLYSYGLQSPFNADPTGATLSQEFQGNQYGFVVSRVGGGSFVLGSFDLANSADDASGGTVSFSYVDATGVHYEDLALADQSGLQTFTFDLGAISSFALWSNNFQVDNVNVEASTIPVPEPSTGGLLLAGLAALITVRRRKG